MLQIFDTAQGKVVPLQTREPGKVSMYVCGPTVYGPPHLGHGRFALVFDVLRRYLEWSGLEVTYVSNITDIDDKIIERGRAEDRDPAEIARRCEVVWWDAMDRIGVKRPTHDPHATAYVDQMVELIGDLVDAGKAYETSDGVYLDVTAVPGYGLLARQSLDSLLSGARVEAVEEKHNPADFVLWKRAKPGEPTWPSPWGEGRPGWHTECVVMSLHLLGQDFDLHGGGQDLAFPHHENERAQAVALGRTFARHWMHNGFVEVSGEKMSKCSATSPICSISPSATIPGPIAYSCSAPTIGRRSRSPPPQLPTRSASSIASMPSPVGRPICPTRPLTRLRSTSSAASWTTTSTRRGRWPSSRNWSHGRTRPSTSRTSRRPPFLPRPPSTSAPPSASNCGPATGKAPTARSSGSSPSATTPRRPRTTPPPIACATMSRRAGG